MERVYQEEIYKLYKENYRNMEMTQNGDHLYRPDNQHPNLSTGPGHSLSSPDRAKIKYTQRSENEEGSSFSYVLKSNPNGPIFNLNKIAGNVCYLKGSDGKEYKYPHSDFINLFEEI